jgi:DNA-directed RNA polymerase sigma subunit (sigma70/sigma32)
MSKSDILQELPKLTPEERQEVRLRLAELDGDDWLDEGVLTDAEKALLEERFRDLDANPQTSMPWEEAKARLLAPFKR